jgi:heat shock protein HslJ
MTTFVRTALILSLSLASGVGNLVLSGCASSERSRSAEDPQVDVSAVFGEWTLTAYGDGTAPSESGRGAFMTVDAGGRVFGSGGVNRFSGALDAEALKAGRFDVSEIVSTKMAGPEAAMRDEARFIEMLERATHWQIEEGSGLVLLDESGVLAGFWRRSAGGR